MFPVIISDNQRVSSENVSCSNPLCANYDGAQDGIQGSEALLNFTIIKKPTHQRNCRTGPIFIHFVGESLSV